MFIFRADPENKARQGRAPLQSIRFVNRYEFNTISMFKRILAVVRAGNVLYFIRRYRLAVVVVRRPLDVDCFFRGFVEITYWLLRGVGHVF